MDLSAIVRESQNIQSKALIETLDKATLQLQNENGKIGNQKIADRLVTLDPLGDALVIGDLHGDFESLCLILRESQFLQKMEKANDATLIFLGDYGDRGDKPAEVYYLILSLKLAFQKQVVLLRGNHEGPKDLVPSPHDLPERFQSKFGEDSLQVYEKTRALWACLYNGVFVEKRFLMVHGGVSPEVSSLQDIGQAQEGHNEGLLEDLLWSDPAEGMHGVSLSPRGAGKLFGEDVTEQVLDRLKAQILIRGHEASGTGFKINHGGKILTLFSRKGAPYFNRYGAYLQVPLSLKFENVKQLTPFIHKF
ncbi:MAG: metallophosphoesterase [Candidatus Bathyarchaeia archaeon]